jgi:hypothetical protein
MGRSMMRTGGFFILAFDILFIAASVYLIINFWSFSSNSVQVSGTISSINVFGKTKPRYNPSVRFETVTGATVEFEDSSYTTRPDYKVGDQVEVLYDARDPSNAKLKSTFSSLLILPVVFSIVSVVLLGISVLLLVLDRRAGRNPSIKGYVTRPDPAALAEIQRLIKQGRLIDAIKLYREATGAGLIEAKDAIEGLNRGQQ